MINFLTHSWHWSFEKIILVVDGLLNYPVWTKYFRFCDEIYSQFLW